MSYGIIVKVLGKLLFFQAVALLLPLGISIYFAETDTNAFLITLIILLATSLIVYFLPIKPTKIQVKEALSIVALGWILVSFFGALPFYLSGSMPSFVDALFESVSGLTTTGATIIDDIEVLPKGILFWRSFTHWLGGMGIIVLTLAILPALGVGGYQIFKAETPGPTAGKLAPRMRDTAKILYGVYLSITGIQILLLYFGGLSFYEALVHTFGTVGTGGFSTRNNSIGAFNSAYITLVISFFMVAAGVNFSLYYDFYQGKWKRVIGNSELQLYLSIVIGATVLIFINLYGSVYTSVFETFQHAVFQVAAFITTTGYGTANYETWPAFSQGILLFLMFVGGSAGSTAGSIKIIRHLVLFKVVKREIGKALHPRALIPINVDGKTISNEVESNIVAFFGLYLGIFALGSLLIMLIENLAFITATTSVAATIGNIGPGFQLVGPGNTYSFFSSSSKLLLSFFMLLGRLELFTLFILITPDFWKK